MSGTPWFKFYASDWLAGTRSLTPAETGVYITLVAMMYEHGGRVTRDDRKLARLCNCATGAFSKIISSLIADGKIEETNGCLFNPRVERELSIRRNQSEKARDSANSRWSKHGEKYEENQQSLDAKAMRTQCERNANQIPDTRNQSIGSGDGTRARQEPEIMDPVDEFEEIVTAAGVDLDKDITCKWRSSGQMWIVGRWRELGLSQTEILTEVRDIQRGRNGPPGSLKYFDTAMQRAAGRKQAPPLEAIQPASVQGARYDQPTRETHDERVIRLALEMRRNRQVDRASGIE